jgi:hypothetical protein
VSVPGWLQPVLWIACIALTGCAIVLIWRKLAPTVERWHVEAPPENLRHWKHSALALSLLLLIVIVALVAGFAARHFT